MACTRPSYSATVWPSRIIPAMLSQMTGDWLWQLPPALLMGRSTVSPMTKVLLYPSSCSVALAVGSQPSSLGACETPEARTASTARMGGVCMRMSKGSSSPSSE